MNEIHFHTDIESLRGNFINRFGHPIIVDYNTYLIGYFLQGSNIVKMCYSRKQAINFIEKYKGDVIPPLYFYIDN